MVGGETLVTRFGDNYPALDQGEYQWLLRDLNFGWVGDRRGEVTLLDPKQGTLVVQRNLAAAIRPVDTRRNPAAAAEMLPLQFHWNGTECPLEVIQAEAVQYLANAALTPQPAVAESVLVEKLNEIAGTYGLHGDGNDYINGSSPSGFGLFSGDSPRVTFPIASLADVFQQDGQPHAAWGALIVPGAIGDTFRLAPANLGTLKFQQTDAVRNVVIDAGDEILEFLQPGERTLSLRGGEYEVEFIPTRPDVAWMRPSSEGYWAFPCEHTVTVTAGEELTLDLQPQLSDALRPQAFLTDPEANPLNPSYLFRWYGYGNLTELMDADRDPDGQNGFYLNHYQAACIARLLKGLVDGHPDVPESELQEIAIKAGFRMQEAPAGGGQPAAETAAGNENDLLPPAEPPAAQEPPSLMEQIFPDKWAAVWDDLLAPGAAPATWRLKIPAAPPADLPLAGNLS
jgi:hypothetical protein